MARAFGASLTVLRVLELPRAEGTQASTYPLEWETRRSVARRDLDRICEEHQSPDLPIDTVLLEGRVTEEIRQWVSRHGVDLAVLCSHGAGGWTKDGLASTAKHLVQSLSVPTLLIPASILDELPKQNVAYEGILVPLDASPEAEQALPLAVRLAPEHGSEMILIHVVPMPELIKPEPLNEEERELERRLIERNTRVAERYLGRLSDQLSHEGVRVRTVLTHDDVRFELMGTIEREHPDLIVLSGHGRGGRTPLRLGSVASFLVEHATVPTLIVRAHGSPASPRRRS
jgi:nucleotide-binding universal stress UspA family protein